MNIFQMCLPNSESCLEAELNSVWCIDVRFWPTGLSMFWFIYIGVKGSYNGFAFQ